MADDNTTALIAAAGIGAVALVLFLNKSGQAAATTPAGTTCAAGYTYDSVLGGCIANTLAPSPPASPPPASTSFTCGPGYTPSTACNCCVANTASSPPASPVTPASPNCPAGYTSVLGVCIPPVAAGGGTTTSGCNPATSPAYQCGGTPGVNQPLCSPGITQWSGSACAPVSGAGTGVSSSVGTTGSTNCPAGTVETAGNCVTAGPGAGGVCPAGSTSYNAIGNYCISPGNVCCQPTSGGCVRVSCP